MITTYKNTRQFSTLRGEPPLSVTNRPLRHEKKVLIIDDDTDLLQIVRLMFKSEGLQVFTASDGLDGISKLFVNAPDLIILDVMMPGSNGFEVCRRIRQVSDTPLIMLTALNKEQEMLHGLEAGADDFLSKPFNPDILRARARSLLRRSKPPNGAGESFNYDDGYLNLDIERHDVLIRENRIKLTPVEFRLLAFLIRNAGKALTIEKILDNVWGPEYRGSIAYVHEYISHLRRKIEEDARNPCYILTVRGVGYMFEKQALA